MRLAADTPGLATRHADLTRLRSLVS